MIIRGATISGIDIYGESPLYDFTAWTFTNGNSSGRTGPTVANLRVLYNTTGNTWINDDAYFTVTGGIQYWTVPSTGTYTITAAGASGGAANVGRGARISGTFSLTKGETVRILVGQMGSNTSAFYSGGGGASFVMRTPFNSNAAIAVIAGGGGGTSYRNGLGTGNTAPAAGSATTFPGITSGQARATGGGGGGATAAGGLNGANGSTSSSGWAGGGGGVFGNGGSQSGGGSGGLSFTNGGTGGTGPDGAGGFGGGGGASISGGGAGGYNGGSNTSSGDAAAGGGSFNNGSSPSATANINLGHGSVTITFVSGAL